MSGLPRGWVEATFGQVTKKIGSGATPTGGEHSYKASGIPLIRSLNVHFDGVREEGLAFLDEKQAAKLNNVVVEADDVLLNITGASIGRVAVAPSIYTGARVNQHVSIIRLVQEVLPQYIRSFLASPAAQDVITRENYGATRQALTKSMIEEFAFPLPPLAEQKRIVAKLDALSAKSARARTDVSRIETLVSRYKQALLSKAFSGELTREWRDAQARTSVWQSAVISDIADVVTGSTPKTAEKDRFFGGDTPFFKPTDLDQGYHVKFPRETLSAAGVAVSRLVPAQSVLVTCIGATIGKVGFARVACCTNQQINALVPNITLASPEWLYWMVSSPDFQALILANSSATTLPIINKGRFQQLPLAVPSLEEQHEIVRRIESAFAKIDRLALEARVALKLLGKLDEAILAKAFRGELVPQNENDEPAEHLLERIRGEHAAAPKEKTRTVKRKTIMLTARDFLKAKLENWPADGVSFQDLKREFGGTYDDLKEAVFASLSGEQSPLQQIFDDKTSTLAIRKRER